MPLNVEVRFIGSSEVAYAITVNGRLVPSRVVMHGQTWTSYVRLKPLEPLEPFTEYVVGLGSLAEDGGIGVSENGRVEGFGLLVTKFTTSDAVDREPPGFAGIGSTRFINTKADLFAARTSCGEALGYQVQVPDGLDDQTPVDGLTYHVYAGATPDEVDLSVPVMGTGSGLRWYGNALCSPVVPLGPGGTLAVAVTAVDWAGNESAIGRPVQLSGCGCRTGEGSSAALLILVSVLHRLQRGRRSTASRR